MNTHDATEAARRVGWARYYEAEERLSAERLARRRMEEVLRVLARGIAHHDRLHADDPLVRLAVHCLLNSDF